MISGVSGNRTKCRSGGGKGKASKDPVWKFGSFDGRIPLNSLEIYNKITDGNSKLREDWKRNNLKSWRMERLAAETPPTDKSSSKLDIRFDKRQVKTGARRCA